jgi:hypothetical protein
MKLSCQSHSSYVGHSCRGRLKRSVAGLLRLHTQWRRLRRAASRQTRRHLLLSGDMMGGSCTGVMKVNFANNVHAAFAPRSVATCPSHPRMMPNLNDSISCTQSRPQRGRYRRPLPQSSHTLDSSLGQQSLREYECIATKRKDSIWKRYLAIVETNIADTAVKPDSALAVFFWTAPQPRIRYAPSPAIVPHDTSLPYSNSSLVRLESLAPAIE